MQYPTLKGSNIRPLRGRRRSKGEGFISVGFTYG